VFYELAARRALLKRADVAIIRVEQVYPFHSELMKKILAGYPAGAERVWVQEEPRNAGAYTFIADVMRTQLGTDLSYIGREASATPAVGSKHKHKEQQEAVIAGAIGPVPDLDGPVTGGNGVAVQDKTPSAAAKKAPTRN
jgi:2-oxoglutarate dehydrogenase E1 component